MPDPIASATARSRAFASGESSMRPNVTMVTRHGWPSRAHPLVDSSKHETPSRFAQSLMPHLIYSYAWARNPAPDLDWQTAIRTDPALNNALAYGGSSRGAKTRRKGSIARTLNGLASGAASRLDVLDRKRLEQAMGLKPGQMQRAVALESPRELRSALMDEVMANRVPDESWPEPTPTQIANFRLNNRPIFNSPRARIDESFLVLAAWSLLRFRRRGNRLSDVRNACLALYEAAQGGYAAFERAGDMPLCRWYMDGLLFAGDDFDWEMFVETAGVGRQWAISVAGSVLANLVPHDQAAVIYADAQQIAARMRQLMIALPVFRPDVAAVPNLCRYVFGHEGEEACERVERIRQWASCCESDGCFGPRLWSLIAEDVSLDDVPESLREALHVEPPPERSGDAP